VAGATWTTAGRAGQALCFDGVNDRININDSASLDLTGGMTLEAWVYPTALSGWHTVIMKERTGGLVYALYAHDNAPRPAVYIRVGSVDVAGISPLSLNAWTYLAALYQRLAARRGKKRAIMALAHTIVMSASHMLSHHESYQELGANYFDDQRLHQLVDRLAGRPERLGYRVSLEAVSVTA
jgi:Concanavalin A-like lectin/glucanases superfamily